MMEEHESLRQTSSISIATCTTFKRLLASVPWGAFTQRCIPNPLYSFAPVVGLVVNTLPRVPAKNVDI
jgi:hypothetical protein